VDVGALSGNEQLPPSVVVLVILVLAAFIFRNDLWRWAQRKRDPASKIVTSEGQPYPRPPDLLPGWTWSTIEDPLDMKVTIEERSPDGRHVTGVFTAKPGAFNSYCGAQTEIELIEGKTIIASDNAELITLGVGDRFKFEPNTTYGWQFDAESRIRFGIRI
jgi:uncharacterized cupin superfamily protein